MCVSDCVSVCVVLCVCWNAADTNSTTSLFHEYKINVEELCCAAVSSVVNNSLRNRLRNICLLSSVSVILSVSSVQYL
jgi:hypothetical protein